MSKYEECDISDATLLTSIFIINVGQIGPKLSNQQNGVTKAVHMKKFGEVVELRVEDKFQKIATKLVPLSYFSDMTPVK